jgi:hypothetical protein
MITIIYTPNSRLNNYYKDSKIYIMHKFEVCNLKYSRQQEDIQKK